MIDTSQVHAHFDLLWADLEDENDFPNKRPLLAHYTVMSTLEGIMRNEELWMANPLFMNDMEELTFGLNESAKAFRQHAGIEEACGSRGERYTALRDAFEQLFERLGNEDAFDTYCMCFCEHTAADYDGVLSMWRGYGGNGSGAAVVFDTGRVPTIDTSPLILAKVHYATREQRLQWIQDKLDLFAILLKKIDIPTSMFYVPLHSLLERFKLFALFSKHNGFKEEQEWRLVYVKDRDRKNQMADMFDYFIRGNRVEPKLKLKVGSISGVPSGLRVQELVDRIILGPSASTPLAVASVKRMLKILGKEDLCNKVHRSSTPYRSI